MVAAAKVTGFAPLPLKVHLNALHERAAMGGFEMVRHNFGESEADRGNMDRTMKHRMLAPASGYEDYLREFRVIRLFAIRKGM